MVNEENATEVRLQDYAAPWIIHQYQMGGRICLKAQVYFRTGAEFQLQGQRAVIPQLQVSSTGKTKHSVSAELHMDASEYNSVHKLHLHIILQMSQSIPNWTENYWTGRRIGPALVCPEAGQWINFAGKT